MTGLRQDALPPTQLISRLPAGAPNSCQCNDEDRAKHANLPTTSKRLIRPVCLVFEELNPNAASKDKINVQHIATQTGDHINFENDTVEVESSESIMPKNRRENLYSSRGTMTKYDALLKYNYKPRNSTTQTDNDNIKSDPPTQNVDDKKESDPPKVQQDFNDTKDIVPCEFYNKSAHPKKYQKKTNRRPKDLPWQINSNQPKLIQKKSIWRHPLQRLYPKITVNSQSKSDKDEEEKKANAKETEAENFHSGTQQELQLESDDKNCANCAFIPMFGNQLSKIHFKMDVLEADVMKLQTNVQDLKTQKETKEASQMKPCNKESTGLFVVYKTSKSNPSWETFQIPKQPHSSTTEGRNNYVFDLNRQQDYQQTNESLKPGTSTQSKSIQNISTSPKIDQTQESKKETKAISFSSQTEPEVQPKTDPWLKGKPSSTQGTKATDSCIQTDPEVQPKPDPWPERKPSSTQRTKATDSYAQTDPEVQPKPDPWPERKPSRSQGTKATCSCTQTDPEVQLKPDPWPERKPSSTQRTKATCSCTQTDPKVQPKPIPWPKGQPSSVSLFGSNKPCTSTHSKSFPNASPFCNTEDKPRRTQGTKATCVCSQAEPAMQPKSNTCLERKPSSVCLFCSDNEPPVFDNLLNQVKLIANRPLKFIMLTVLLRADNIYHVNVTLRDSKQILGCFLVNHAAIEEAIDQGVFKKILTYSVIDIRNTIKPIGRPFGIPFEFVAKPRENQQNDTEASRSIVAEDAKTLQFITNILGVHVDKLKLNH